MISIERMSAEKKKLGEKMFENQYFDQEGNLFSSLCRSNIGTPLESKISSVKVSPIFFDNISTPGIYKPTPTNSDYGSKEMKIPG